MIRINKEKDKLYLTIEATTKIAKPGFTALPFEKTEGQFEELIEKLGNQFVLLRLPIDDQLTTPIKGDEYDFTITKDVQAIAGYTHQSYDKKDVLIYIFNNPKDITKESGIDSALINIRNSASGARGYYEVQLIKMADKDFQAIIDQLNRKYEIEVSILREQGLDKITPKDRLSLFSNSMLIILVITISPILILLFLINEFISKIKKIIKR